MKIPRLLSIKSLQKYFKTEQPAFLSEHSTQVCKLALEIFKQTKFLHNLGKKEKRILAYGALLHDVGYAKDVMRHNKHSRDIILEMKLPRCSKKEQKMIACIARYHRGTFPSPTHKVYRELNQKERRVVSILSAIVRIADGLDYTHQSSVKEIIGKYNKEINSLVFELTFKPGVSSYIDIERGRNKADLFTHIFRIPVVIMEKKIA
ncbi:MAG: HD domain-containing protein [Candidatus Hydrogenedentes bacterium]|nr:HD domain-containing protein [Candidatus Hydrogenedentota bacterium]